MFVLLAIVLTASGSEALPAGVVRTGPAELKIERQFIGSPVLERPTPQGMVDSNPPWLHAYVPLPEVKSARKAQKWNQRYYFKLSQDPGVTGSVIASGPRRWSFFFPGQTLDQGIWYWTFAVAPAESPDNPVWNNPVYQFQIPANAFTPAIPPTADQVLAIVKIRSGPVVVCAQDDIGKLLPTKIWPEFADRIQEDLNKALVTGRKPISIELSEKDAPASLANSPKDPLFYTRIRGVFTVKERMVDALLRGYLLTGNPEFRKLGVARAIELEDIRQHKTFTIFGKSYAVKDRALYNSVPLLILDAFYDDLTPDQRKTFTDLVMASMEKDEGSPFLHEQLEHAHYNQHAWQQKVQNLLMGSLILSRHRPEMEDWFKYAYELWLYRSPAISRTDGGCIDGNGYLNVHDEPLVHSTWTLYRLTGYNYFKWKRWFDAFPTYMAYMNAVGNPGVPFSDGGDTPAAMWYLTEMLAYINPDNPANLWRFKSLGRRDFDKFADDINKGSKCWDLLALWSRVKAPDLAGAKPPGAQAAAFRDVGVAAMHGDILNPQNNLLATFSSAPGGSFQHLHPSQNAFCIAYGGEPLFWRTGYYNAGPEHDVLSYKCSRAHNTIIADGCVQGFDLGAYGWLPRFATSDKISYVLGDASQAYNGAWPKYGVYADDGEASPSPRGKKKMPVPIGEGVVPITREYGFGKPGVTRFRRHLVLLRPLHVLIYDELEAESPIQWTFMLHSRQPMTKQSENGFSTGNTFASSNAWLFCQSPIRGEVTNQFLGKPTDLQNKRGGRSPDNWHASMTTTDRLQKSRFLTVIETIPGQGTRAKAIDPTNFDNGRINLLLGGYKVVCELNPENPSYLEVRDTGETCALVTGQGTKSISLGTGRKDAKFHGSTLLWERDGARGEKFNEVVDTLPDILVYGNRF